MALQIARKRFTIEEYHRMAEAGILHEDDRVELIDGEIVEMSPIGKHHAAIVNRLNAIITEQVGRRAIISPKNPLLLSDDSEPQPDIALFKFRDDYYAGELPTPSDTLLIIEAADSSLDFDRLVKLPRYARGGVPEVWIVNLAAGVIEVFREPVAGEYRETTQARRGDRRDLPGVVGAHVRVEDVLG
jgi:Uma2 family endonuclease